MHGMKLKKIGSFLTVLLIFISKESMLFFKLPTVGQQNFSLKPKSRCKLLKSLRCWHWGGKPKEDRGLGGKHKRTLYMQTTKKAIQITNICLCMTLVCTAEFSWKWNLSWNNLFVYGWSQFRIRVQKSVAVRFICSSSVPALIFSVVTLKCVITLLSSTHYPCNY
jgi:hypothetical protein